ncbi:helix-turn-helix domain-containing protein [Dysosmobacter sp. Phy]
MKIGEIIREKRRAQSLTQEQLADLLGVSAPAVHKWEKGTTYPDITTLPALARVLHTDLNTLLSFREDLTAEEIARFTNDLDKMIREEGYEAAFQRGMDEIHQYPNCEALMYSVIFYLDGARFLYGVPNPDDYTERLMPFYETMSHSQTPEIRDAALTMCIAYHRNRKDFARAEELINTIPSTRIDKEEQLATLYTQQEKWEDAQRLWEHRILQSATKLQTALIHLMEIAEQEGRPQDAQFCADTYQQVSSLLHVTKWIPYTAKFQLASLRQDRAACLAALRHILPVLKEPWNPQACPLYRHMGDGDLTALARSLYDRITEDLEHSQEFAFFRGSPEYEQLRPLLKETAGAKE